MAIAANENNIPNQDLYLQLINQRLDLLRQAGIQLYVQDARDYNSMTRIMGKLKPQTVVQLAAIAHANRANKDPFSTFDHNLRTLENALDCAKGMAGHFIYFSSSMVYGNFETGTVDEDTVCHPLGIYGALKYSGELMTIAYNQVFDLPYTIVRPSALYGERCVSRRVGQVFIENALQGLDVTISGDGSDRLDFTYVGDFVQGLVKIIGNENSFNETFNITYGESRSIAQMAEILKEHFPGINLKYQPRDRLMPSRGTLSVEKAKKLVGYDPGYPLEKGFVEYIQWYKKLYEKNGANGKA